MPNRTAPLILALPWAILAWALATCPATAAPPTPDHTQPARLAAPLAPAGPWRIVRVSPAPPTTDQRIAPAGALPASLYPRPAFAGFSPLVAITTSNKQSYVDVDWEHDLEYTYTGAALNPPANQNYVIGLLDSGAEFNFVAGQATTTLGVTGAYLTGNTFGPIGGAGGEEVYADLSQPIGFFTAGLDAIQPNGELDLTQCVGHSNVSICALPPIVCGGEEAVTAVVGRPLLSFFTSVIRVDTPRKLLHNGQILNSPDVSFHRSYTPSTEEFPHRITVEFGGLSPATTANYYGDFEDLETPIWPTLLSLSPLSIPFGGGFFASIDVAEGVPGPTNPLEPMRVMLDTGAQTSIISPGMAGNLNLPTQPDFTVDVCGVGGLTEDVPGYFIDYVKIDALGGALEFEHAPFVVLSLSSPEGGALDGVLGMNFFWDRNIVFEPSLTTDGFLYVSDPIPFAPADFDRDLDVDTEDLAILAAASLADPNDNVWDYRCDIAPTDGDNRINALDFAAFASYWLDITTP